MGLFCNEADGAVDTFIRIFIVFLAFTCYNGVIMAQSITIDVKTIQKILTRLDKLSKDVKEIKEKIVEEPAHGSDEWWEKEIKKGEQDIQTGDYYELKDKQELKDFFKNIRSDASNEKYHHKVRK